jgi:uncharacterized protein (DUF488 family)
MEPLTLYTVGHGNRTLEEFLALLRGPGIQALVDVRAQPHSGRNPQFSETSLRPALEAEGIQYHWAGRQLGGRRPPQAVTRHLALAEDLRGYADYMDGAAFRQAALQLQRMATQGATAILCAERDPAHCHRRLIADYLTLRAVRVIHLLAAGEQREHGLSPEARRESAELVYDRNPDGQGTLFDHP